MKKIAIFSDIHGNYQALKAIVDDIKKDKFDEIICLGDVIAIGPNPRECLDLIINNNIKLILGNHELYFLYGTGIDDEMLENQKNHQKWVANNLNDDHKQYLNKQNLKYELVINNKKICFEHFPIYDNAKGNYPFYPLSILKDGSVENILKKYDCDYVFFGHEHKPFKIDIDNKHYICIGSSGCTSTDSTYYMVLEIYDDRVIIEKKELIYDRKAFEINLKNTDYPDKELISKICFR